MKKLTRIERLAIEYGVPEHRLVQRIDGRIEWICKHGVGHTIYHPKGEYYKTGFVHCCDGCCKQLKKS